MLDGRRGRQPADRVAGAAQAKLQVFASLDDERRDLLDRPSAEARAKHSAPNAAVQVVAASLEVARVEGFVIVAGQMELDRRDLVAIEATSDALDHERRVGGLEPVPLALAENEVPAVRGVLHGAEEEREHQGIDHLGAVVEDAPVSIDLVPILAHGSARPAPPGQGRANQRLWRSRATYAASTESRSCRGCQPRS